MRLVVQTLRTATNEQGLAEDLTEALVVHLGERGRDAGLLVVSEAEVKLMLDRLEDLPALGSEDAGRAEAYLARISKAVDGAQLLYGRFDRLGGSFVGVLSLLDATNAAVARSVTWAAETKSEFRTALLEAADDVLDLRGASSAKMPSVVLAPGKKIGVVPVRGLTDQPDVAPLLTQILGVTLRAYEYSVLTRDETLEMLHHATDWHSLQSADSARSDLTEEIIRLARTMGADYLATGTVGRIDDTIIIVLKLIDLEQARAVHRVAESYRGPIAHLPAAMRFAAAKLFGRTLGGTGALSLLTDAKGYYEIDQGGKDLLPQGGPLSGLSVDKHQLNITAEGYYPYFADVYIEDGASPLRFKPELEPRPPPFYKSTWFWSVVGVAAALSTTAVLLAAIPPEGAGGGVRFEGE